MVSTVSKKEKYIGMKDFFSSKTNLKDKYLP